MLAINSLLGLNFLKIMKKNLLLILLLFAGLFFSCTEDPVLTTGDDPEEPSSGGSSSSSTQDDTYVETNTLIYETMASKYFWRDSIPAMDDTNTYLDSESYFSDELRYRVNELVSYDEDTYGDRFSYMESNTDTKATMAYTGYPLTDWGFECMYWMYNGDVYFVQVLYVVPDSPAAIAGLKRGDLMNKIDGTTITSSNMATLLSVSNPSINIVDQYLKTIDTIELVQADFDDTPLIYSAVIEGSEPKTGYFFYTEFKNDSQYETQLKEMFAEFKEAGVENVIIDLRYNPGGYVSTAMLIASALTPSQSDLGNTVMFKTQGNASSSTLVDYKYSSASSIGGTANHVAPMRLGFIMSSYTASASELLYISLSTLYSSSDCVLVGETSMGKNLASNSYEVSDWTLHPITARIYNMNGVSGYEEGLDPDVVSIDIDGSDIELKDVGDTDERMLSVVLKTMGISVSSSSTTGSDRASASTKSSLSFSPKYGQRKEYSSVLMDIE